MTDPTRGWSDLWDGIEVLPASGPGGDRGGWDGPWPGEADRIRGAEVWAGAAVHRERPGRPVEPAGAGVSPQGRPDAAARDAVAPVEPPAAEVYEGGGGMILDGGENWLLGRDLVEALTHAPLGRDPRTGDGWQPVF